MRRLHSGDIPQGLSTGFPDLDRLIGGLRPGGLTVVASTPCVGKTSLVLDIARHAAVRERKSVGVFSIGLSLEQTVDRLLASESGVDLWRMRTGKLSQGDLPRIERAGKIFSEARLCVNDAATPRFVEIKALVQRLRNEGSVELLVVDNLELIREEGENSGSRDLTDVALWLEGLAKELDVPIVTTISLPPSENEWPPHPRDLRRFGNIERAADAIIFIYREDLVRDDSDRKNIAELRVEYNRGGYTGRAELYFDEREASFKNLESPPS